jgi:hypothetical protein
MRYQPPPPVDAYGGALVYAIRDAVEGRYPNVKSIRSKVRDLGQTLVRLSGDRHVEKSRLRRWLRRGARVAGSLIVALSVAAAGVAAEAWVTGHTGDPVPAAGDENDRAGYRDSRGGAGIGGCV